MQKQKIIIIDIIKIINLFNPILNNLFHFILTTGLLVYCFFTLKKDSELLF